MMSTPTNVPVTAYARPQFSPCSYYSRTLLDHVSQATQSQKDPVGSGKRSTWIRACSLAKTSVKMRGQCGT